MTMSAFRDIYLVTKHRSKGELQLESDVVEWKSQYSSKRIHIDGAQVARLQWTPMGNTFQLTFHVRGGVSTRFQGFEEAALKTWEAFAEKCGKPLEHIKRSSHGWNWGEMEFGTNDFTFNVSDQTAFEVPYSDIAQCLVQGQNEVIVEMHQDDTARAEDEDVVEMRFFVPSSRLTGEEDAFDASTGEVSTTSAANLHACLVQRTSLGQGSEENIASLSDILLVVPRGRYGIDMFANHFVLHGKTYTFKILYKSISRLFLLPKPNGQLIFVVALDPAIRQSTTLYTHLLMQFDQGDEMELSPNISEEVIREKYAAYLSPTMQGAPHDIVSRLFRAFSGKKVVSTGSFRNAAQEQAIMCSLKTNDGLLFPLDKSFFFIHKPPLHLRFEDIQSVEFGRVDAAGNVGRTFDLIVTMRGGDTKQHIFASIEKDEYSTLLEFLESKRLHIVNAKVVKSKKVVESVSMSGRKRRTVVQDMEEDDNGAGDESDEEEDEDFDAGNESASDSEDYSSKSEDSSGDERKADDGGDAMEDDDEDDE